MLKVTLKIVIISLLGCNQVDEERQLEAYGHQLNIDAEAIIDAAFVTINKECDSLLKQNIIRVTDSILAIGKKPNVK